MTPSDAPAAACPHAPLASALSAALDAAVADGERALEPLRDLRPADREPIGRILRAAGVFGAAEVAVGLELVDGTLEPGPATNYRWVVAEGDGQVLGFACFGPVPMTQGTFDLYWIAVDPRLQGRGLGRRLVAASEAAIRAGGGGRRLYVDTSSTPAYAPTRAFYAACGYAPAAELPDFYAPGDGKVILCKVLA
jgi:ribosomal protein S18 acetylase RimI-like enzyme